MSLASLNEILKIYTPHYMLIDDRIEANISYYYNHHRFGYW